MPKILKKFPEPSEFVQQCNVVEFCFHMASKYPDLELINASMNGSYIPGSAPRVEKKWINFKNIKSYVIENFRWKLINMLKASGCLRKGFPDLNLPVPRGIWHGLYIELKKKSSGRLSGDQIWWINQLTEQGYYACTCRGEEAAKRLLIEYVSGKL